MSARCDVCPHNCILEEGEAGKCLVRRNIGGKVQLEYYGKCSRLAVEPIEKRPLFHFYPGSKFLSVGFLGCSFSCSFCQNHTVSQVTSPRTKDYSPENLVDLALAKKTAGIAFTYNEPTVYYEYILDVGLHITLHQIPMHMAIKTNGFASKTVLRNLALFNTAFNVDIKGDDREYETICGGALRDVMESVEWLVEIGAHVEVSYLVLPKKLKDKKYHRFLRDWLASLNKSIPVHLLFFFPFYNMSGAEAYQPEDLLEVAKIFRRKMKYVYISNNYDKSVLSCRNTVCRKCGKSMISRARGTKILNLQCCGQKIAGLKT